MTGGDGNEDGGTAGDVPGRVRSYLLAEHRDLLATVLDCADAVAAGWDGQRDGLPATTNREHVVGPLRATLERAGVLGRLPEVLAGCVDAAGFTMRADPVAAPPYVAVTSRGPLLRATLDPGRLVVAVAVFRVIRDDRSWYVRTSGAPDGVLDVALR